MNQVFEGRISCSEDGGSMIVGPDDIIAVLKELKEDRGVTFLEDVTAVDYPENFTVVYHLMNLEDASVLRVKVLLADKKNPQIESAVTLWKAANVMERETYDLVGVYFQGHPDMRRVLCPDDFRGHPLRKDFKLEPAARQ